MAIIRASTGRILLSDINYQGRYVVIDLIRRINDNVGNMIYYRRPYSFNGHTVFELLALDDDDMVEEFMAMEALARL